MIWREPTQPSGDIREYELCFGKCGMMDMSTCFNISSSGDNFLLTSDSERENNVDVQVNLGLLLMCRVLSGDFFSGGKHGLVWSASGGCYKGVKHGGNGLVWSGGCIRGLSEYPCEYALPV